MPEADFNKNLNLPSAGGKFLKLSKKGDTVKFVIAKTPHYVTKHFLPDNSVVVCTKFNTDEKNQSCKYCDDYEKAKDLKDEKMEKQLKPVVNFYYPILNLTENKAQVFQFTAKSIHYTIKNYAVEGIDVFNTIWKVERTEEKGNYYPVLSLGTPKLSKEQQEILEQAKAIKLSGTESGSVSAEEDQVPTEE